jgi:hypothetical protein
VSGSSGYLNQVEACRYLASQRPEAVRVADDPPEQRQRLRQAVELAVRAVLTAWAAPAAKPERLWAAFEDPISGLVGSDTAA